MRSLLPTFTGGVFQFFKFRSNFYFNVNAPLLDGSFLASTNTILRPLPSLNHHYFSPYNRSSDSSNSNSILKTPQSTKKMKNITEGQSQQQERQVDSGRTSSSSADTNPKVNELQNLVRSDASGGWEKCWEEGMTPWDLGQPTPIMVHLHKTDALPKGRALIPGCGSGHDVVAIACPERFVVGLDVADKAIKNAKELSSSLPNADHCTFLKEDFFNWRPNELFDLIVDYTFFCAIEPEMRSSWARQVQDLLKPNGELITLMFPMDDHVGGPPYAVSVADYEEVLHPMGFKLVSIEENELAVAPRKGREKLGRWKRFTNPSSL